MALHIASKTLEDIDFGPYLGSSGELDGLTLYLETLSHRFDRVLYGILLQGNRSSCSPWTSPNDRQ